MKLLCAFSCLTGASASIRHKVVDELVMQTMHTSETWKHECGSSKVKHSFSFLQAQNPGAGMDPDAVQPFQQVFKDGFMLVACVKDAMYVHGDKFGNNKFDYKMGGVSNSSIVHYSEHVAKEDRAPMTHSVCFEFCRGIEDMGYFGISNGRDCYCTPYYKQMASDSSQCDATCEGDNTLMCGGAKKNSMFAMHACADTASDLGTAEENADEAERKLSSLAGTVADTAGEGESDANYWQKALGLAGDPSGAAQMQKAKVFAGKCQDEAKAADKLAGNVGKTLEGIAAVEGPFTDYANAKAAEDAMKKSKTATAEAEEALEALQATMDKLRPAISEERSAGSAKQYYPIMYFVDEKFAKFPSTCDGDLAADPVMTVSQSECAASCDALTGKCVGYAYYERSSSLCFLYSEFKSVQYWTGCKTGPPQKPQKTKKGSFLEVSKDGQATCKAKLQVYEGTTLKPDPEGKCKQCLKEATKADRCY